MAVDPRVAAFQVGQRKLETARNARSVDDWIRLLSEDTNASPGERDLLQKLRANPDAYEIHGGSLRTKPSWLAKNWPMFVVGGAIAAPYVAGAIGGISGGSAAGSASAAGASTAGAGTAATVAGGAATTAGGSMPSWLSPVLNYGLPVVGNVIGQTMQNRAQGASDALMREYYDKALAAEIEERNYRRGFDENERAYRRGFDEDERGYQRNRYANLEKHLAPYQQSGVSANDRLARLMAGAPVPSARTTAPVPGSAAPVRMQAPDGTVSDVPQHLASFYERKGARRA